MLDNGWTRAIRGTRYVQSGLSLTHLRELLGVIAQTSGRKPKTSLIPMSHHLIGFYEILTEGLVEEAGAVEALDDAAVGVTEEFRRRLVELAPAEELRREVGLPFARTHALVDAVVTVSLCLPQQLSNLHVSDVRRKKWRMRLRRWYIRSM